MNRQEVAHQFRTRVNEVLAGSKFNRSGLARHIGIDRSTLSQLLAEDTDRLPRADTAANIAAALNVSLDWLMGLSGESKLGADILLESLQVHPSSPTPVDELLGRWRQEATGYKIRYVPTTLPDLAKTHQVVDHEYGEFVSRSTERMLAETREKLAYTRRPETDMEVCMPIQNIEGFARGEGIWSGLGRGERAEQLDRLIELVEELYPTLRVYLFDGLTHYSVPLTVFGPLRAAIYMGQMYFVFTTTEHVRVITRHFDSLIRAAVVEASQFSDFIRRQRREMA